MNIKKTVSLLIRQCVCLNAHDGCCIITKCMSKVEAWHY